MGVLEEMGKKHGQSLQVIQWNEAMLSNCISNSVYINHTTQYALICWNLGAKSRSSTTGRSPSGSNVRLGG